MFLVKGRHTADAVGLSLSGVVAGVAGEVHKDCSSIEDRASADASAKACAACLFSCLWKISDAVPAISVDDQLTFVTLSVYNLGEKHARPRGRHGPGGTMM